MDLHFDIRYEEAERNVLREAVAAANRVLHELHNSSTHYHVSYIELGVKRLNAETGEMVPQPIDFLAADVNDDA